MTEKFEWSDRTMEMDRGEPEGIGDRWIMMGCGSRNGWLEGTFEIWRGESPTEDYHGNMNAALMEKWTKNYMKIAPDRAVLVVDRAPYHVMLTPATRRATTRMSRRVLSDWLLSHDAVDADGHPYTKAALLQDNYTSPSGRRSS